MAKKEKEEERIERIIRGLLKLPENRRCINCNSLGPQYVCTTFLTFVCTNCSGVHREFTHRVKSVSMAKFKAEEVSALQAGGNERARQIYFKAWDPQWNSYPDGSNLHKLRDFIKHVYVDRKYSGERNQDRLPRLRLSDKRESYESRSRKVDRSKSPSFEDRYDQHEKSHPGGRSDDRSLKYYYDERRSPRYAQENSRYGGLKKSPVRFEVVDDRFRDDGIRSGRQYGSRTLGFRSLSPDHQKSKDILGENALPLQVGECSKATDKKNVDVSDNNQMIPSTNSKGVVDKNQSSETLIDFDADSTAPNSVVAPQALENHQLSNGGICNSNESCAQQNTPPTSKPNTLELLLLELSVPCVEPAAGVYEELNNDNPPSRSMLMSGVVSAAVTPGLTLSENTEVSTIAPREDVLTGGASLAAPPGQMLALNNSAGVTETSGGNVPPGNVSPAVPGEQIPTSIDRAGPSRTATVESMPADCIASAALMAQPMQTSNGGPQQAVPDIHGYSATSQFPNEQQVSSMQQRQTSTATVGALNNQDVAKVVSNSRIKSQHFPAETKYIGRKELPADLFTASYALAPGSSPGWQSTVPHGMGYNMQYYPNSVPVRPYPNQAKSSNPFDLNNETNPVQVSPFPSMENLRATIPNMSVPAALLPTSISDANSSGFMTTQAPSYTSAIPLQSSSFTSATSSGAYMGQQLQHMNVPSSRPEGVAGGYGSSLNMQSSTGYPLPSVPNSQTSLGGNPFG